MCIRDRPPYVYSRAELRRLLDATGPCCPPGTRFDGSTFRILLLVLYGAGLRASEAYNLAIEDVDLDAAVLTVRNAKFFKTRLVPITRTLAGALRQHAAERLRHPLPDQMKSAFLANRDGSGIAHRTVYTAFRRLLRLAEIEPPRDGRRPPNLQSFRHTAAVHRLTSWYRSDADIPRLLPMLAVWLGHASLDGTRVYLSMTPELLQEASRRFDHFVNGGTDA